MGTDWFVKVNCPRPDKKAHNVMNINKIIGESYLFFRFFIDLKLRCLSLITDPEQIFRKRKDEISDSKLNEIEKERSIVKLTDKYDDYKLRYTN